MMSVETVTQHSIRMCRCLTGVINRFKEERRGGLLGIEKRLTLFIRLLRPESGLACVSCRCRCRRTVLQPGPLLGEQVVEDVKDIDVFAEKTSRPSPKENSEKPKRQGSSLPSGILRINKDKFFDAEGNPRPKKYISDRVKAVEGLTVAEAVVLEFPDKAK